MKLSLYEQETIFNYNQEEKTAEIYTCDKALMRKLDNLSLKSDDVKLKNEDELSKTYIIPKRWIRVQMPNKISDEHKEKIIRWS